MGIKVLVAENCVFVDRVLEILNRGHGTHNVRRTARGAEYLHARVGREEYVVSAAVFAVSCLKVIFLHIGIEEALSVKRNTRNKGVVNSLLRNIGLNRPRLHKAHSACEKRNGERRAGFGISRLIRQVVVV